MSKNNSLIEISKSSDIPLIASNDQILNQNDFESHETRVSIQSGYVLSDPRRKRIIRSNIRNRLKRCKFI